MNHITKIFKSGLFLSLLVCSLITINDILEPKFITMNAEFPTTSSYDEFYNMEENSIDVLFLGSSVAANAFIPQEIYNDYGIRSFNLASEQQSIFLSYYWLKEALNYQSPQVVVLDTKFMWPTHPEDVINTTEPLTRKCLDPMRLSPVKIEAIHNLCQLDSNQSELSYYLSNIRFHSRWESLSSYDFNYKSSNNTYLRGYVPTLNMGPSEYKTFESSNSTETMEFVPLMEDYLNKTISLCQDNNIQLVLTSLPGNEMNDAANNTYLSFAENDNVDYYNLCSTEYYSQINANLPFENATDHQNIWGAIKTSEFIGGLLKNTYSIKSTTDEQFESTKFFYNQTIKNASLTQIQNQTDYLSALADPNYAVFFVTNGDAKDIFSSTKIQNGLSSLGLKHFSSNSGHTLYCASIIGGKVTNDMTSPDSLSISGRINNMSTYSINCSGYNLNATSSININNCSNSNSLNGLNITVYDLTTNKVIDKVTFQNDSITRL